MKILVILIIALIGIIIVMPMHPKCDAPTKLETQCTPPDSKSIGIVESDGTCTIIPKQFTQTGVKRNVTRI